MTWIAFPKPEDVAYIAGFFDGEGTVAIAKEPAQGFILQCSAVNTVPEPLEFMCRFFDGKILGPYERETHHKPIYNWKVEAIKAEFFLRAVGPYLKIKLERCLLGLEFRELFHGDFVLPRGKERHLPSHAERREAILDLRREYYERMKSLNTRGIP